MWTEVCLSTEALLLVYCTPLSPSPGERSSKLPLDPQCLDFLTAQPRARPCPGEAAAERPYLLRCQVSGGGLAAEAEHLLVVTRSTLKIKGWTGGQMGSQEEKAEFKESGYRVSDS